MDELTEIEIRLKILDLEREHLIQKRNLLVELVNMRPTSSKEVEIMNDPAIISAVGPSGSKLITSPRSQALGKDTSTPVKPVILVKDEIEEDKSSTSPKPTGLRPNNTDIQHPLKQSGHTDESINIDYLGFKPKYFYVVFNGPHAGIYTDWEQVKKYTDGQSNIKFKRFRSLLQAKEHARVYREGAGLSPLNLIRREVPVVYAQDIPERGLKETYATTLKKVPDRSSSFKTLGTTTRKMLYQELTINDFARLWSKARNTDVMDFVNHNCWTTDKENISLFNFKQGADSELVRKAFTAGLLDMVYPSNNLLEIKHLPEDLYKCIKNFRKNAVKDSEKELYLKFFGPICDWKDGEFLPPFTMVEVGVKNGEMPYYPSKIKDGTFSTEILAEVREIGLRKLINKVYKITPDSKIKVNLFNSNVFVSSWNTHPMSNDDYDKLVGFEKRLAYNQLELGPQSTITMCRLASEAWPSTHQCASCEQRRSSAKENDKGKKKDSPIKSTASDESDLLFD